MKKCSCRWNAFSGIYENDQQIRDDEIQRKNTEKKLNRKFTKGEWFQYKLDKETHRGKHYAEQFEFKF